MKKVQTEYKMGNRCHICTGCGRCREGQGDIHVLTTQAEETIVPLPVGSGKRLVTVDIGTTTIAMQLYDRDGSVQDVFVAVNPQYIYGADVLSRIQAAETPADAQQLQQLVREVLRQGTERFQKQISQQESLQMVIAANTTMVYLLMGRSTTELGKAPFLANHLEAVETVIEDIPCYIFGGLAAFVGGDIVAGILACEMNLNEKITLLIDLGTNGEMVLGNRDKMIACSTAAGPAFEGGVNRGVWGADMIQLLARLRQEEILDETGLLADPYFEQGIRIGDVRVTQEAVRAIQLAKGAVYAGITVLIREYGITMEQIEQVILSGGFGYYLNPQAAAQIGLLPKELVSKTVSGGNTALAGALKMGKKILCCEAKEELEVLREKVEVINLAEMKDFQDVYISAMNF